MWTASRLQVTLLLIMNFMFRIGCVVVARSATLIMFHYLVLRGLVGVLWSSSRSCTRSAASGCQILSVCVVLLLVSVYTV